MLLESSSGYLSDNGMLPSALRRNTLTFEKLIVSVPEGFTRAGRSQATRLALGGAGRVQKWTITFNEKNDFATEYSDMDYRNRVGP